MTLANGSSRNEKLSNAYRLISADLEAAAAIQKNLLPLPSTIRGICFEWLFCPSSFVAGDIFNYFRIDEDRFGFYLLDVLGTWCARGHAVGFTELDAFKHAAER